MKYLRLLFLSVVASLIATTPSSRADVTYEVLTDWSTGPNLRGDKNKLVQGADGDFYGTSAAGGAHGHGCVFKMSPTGDITVLASFTGIAGNLPGAEPQGRLLLAGDGNFYGTTKTGGGVNCGTIFQMLPDGTTTSIADFAGTDGRYPLAGLVEGDNEEFFGTTSSGGISDNGTVFKVTTSGVIDVLIDASSIFGRFDSGLTVGSDGNIYGITKLGGTNSDGGIFRMGQDGSGTIFFANFNFSGTPVFGPNSELVEDADGNFYGTTQDGGAFDTGGKTGGTIYKVTPGGVISTLVEFTGTTGAHLGAWPTGGLTLGADGLLYGTTVSGGSGAGDGLGTVFKVTTTGTFTTLAQLSTTSSSLPDGGVFEGTNGNFYGIGANSIYRLSPAAVFTELADTDRKLGQNPKAGLVEGAAGEFYGVTSAGGFSGDHGTIFKFTSAGVYTELGQFDGNPFSGGVEGALPFSGLIKGADGNFYGTTVEGGANNFGTVFKVTPVGVISTLVEFTGDTGARKGSYPYGALCQDTNGDLYGTTMEGGANGLGTIFKVTSDGVTFTTLLEFDGFNGSYPNAGLVKSTGGFYGTTRTGGTNDLGTAFVVTSGGSLTTLHAFDGTTGSYPSSSLVEVSAGEFYGTTAGGGANDLGTIFKVTAMSAHTTLVEFDGTSGTNLGSVPLSGLIKDSSNNLYGTTSEGGADDLGTIFKVTTTGTLTTLFEFTGDTGAVRGAKPSYAPLLLAANGMLYGTTSTGGDHGGGTLFRVNLNANPVIPPVVTTGSASNIQDTTATLHGSVTLNGTATSYYFEYGEDDSYGETTATQSATANVSAALATGNITGLTAGTTYHYRLVATNIGGTFEGLDATFTTRTFGVSEVIAKGDLAPDDTGTTFGATFLKFSPPAMNDVERFAFMGSMTIGPGGVTKANDTGIWAHNGSGDLMLIAREGDDAVDTTSKFASFGNPVFANNDRVAFLAKLKPGDGITASTATGIWSNTSGTLELVARQGDQVDTLETGVVFSQFVAFALPQTGGVVFLAKIKGPGIKGTNDMGIWQADGTNDLTLVAREGNLIDVNGTDKTITTIQFLPTVKIVGGQARGFSNNGDLTFRVVFSDKTQGILNFSGGVLYLVTTTNDDAYGVTDAKFKTFSQPAIDGSTFNSFLATMQIGPGDVAKVSDSGIWTGGLNLLAREGDPAEGTSGVFASFSDPVAREDGAVAFYAKLKPSAGLVKASEVAGIWSNVSGSLALVARQGQQAAGAATGELYSAFTSVALPDAGGPVFLAKLKTKKNNVGIWATDDMGVVHLVVRTGDTLTINGGPKVVKTLEFLPNVLGVSGQTRSFNTASDLTFRAVFTDKTEAILKVTR